jgi:hypothetical protein
MMIRYRVAEEGIGEVADAVKAAFTAVEARQPEGIRYAYYLRPDSAEFVATLELAEGVQNPLFGIGAARKLQQTVAKWAIGDAPAPQPLEVLGCYGFDR